MNVKIVTERDEFMALAPAWAALATAACVRPFQEFGWAEAWINTLGAARNGAPHVVTLWHSGRLAGALPLHREHRRGVRMLQWIGGRVTDYCDVILDPREDQTECLTRMWAALRAAGGFDVLRLGQVRKDALVRPLLMSLRPWIETEEHTFALPIAWPDSEGWLKTLSKKRRARVRRGMRSLEELGLRFHIWQPGEPLEPAVEATIQQKLAWLAARQAPSALTEPGGVEFIRQLAKRLAASGSLHLSMLQSDQGIVATHFGFMRDRVLYYYMPSYDAAWSRHGVGTLLLEALLRWSCDHGMRRFDMLRGAHDYKSFYGGEPEDLQTLVKGRGLFGRAAVTLYRATQLRKLPAVSSEHPASEGELAPEG